MKNDNRMFDLNKFEYYQQLAAAYEEIRACYYCYGTDDAFTEEDFYEIVDDIYKVSKRGLEDYHNEVKYASAYTYGRLKIHIINSIITKLSYKTIKWQSDMSFQQMELVIGAISDLIILLLSKFEKLDINYIIRKKNV